MSADLFAEFGLGSTSTQTSNSSRPQEAHSQTSSLIPDFDTSDDAFFNLNQSQSQTAQPRIHPTKPATTSRVNSSQRPDDISQRYDSNVLFDASLETVPDDGSDDDDWGEFESAETVPKDQPTGLLDIDEPSQSVEPQGGNWGHSKSPQPISRDLNLMDSLSLGDSKPAPGVQQANSTSQNPAQSRRKLGSSVSAKSLGPPKTPEPPQEDPFEEWGDFIDGPPTEPNPKAKGKPLVHGKGSSHSQAEKTISTPMSKPVPASQVRPTNIPPPSVLLELFPRLLEQLRQEAARAKREMEGLEDASELITCTLKSAARVIAGRSLRWKRDTILSQSMRIGPARSGKTGGMKLNSVNKNEDIKEQQEAVDVVGLWRDRAAVFNSVIQASGKRPIPVVAENVRVLTANASQGAIKASHSCALCGLKRDERLPKIDDAVEDSFGEWWTDHWGHTECRKFWESHMDLLAHR